jgi:peptidoglycan L-alanyl-D-glutamate endopeptidase CwlK
MSGASRLAWPDSKHNQLPSLAIDVCPVPVFWDDIPSFLASAAIVKETAARLGIEIVHGGDFEKLKDYPHYELKQS